MDDRSDETRACPRCGSRSVRQAFLEPPFRVVRCRGCGLTYLSNPPSERGLYDEYYGSHALPAATYGPDAADPRLRELHAINERRISALRQLVPGGRILDVGCGRGFFLETAQRGGFEPVGIDVSAQAVHEARDAFGVDARVATIEDLAGATERFDVVTLWHVLEHLYDPDAELARIRALLRPGGLCLVEVPNLHSLKFMLSRTKWRGGNHPRYHRTFFSARTLREAFRIAGFTDVRRLNLAYRVPGQSRAYGAAKRLSGLAAMDSFLAFAARNASTKEGRGVA